MSDLFRKRYIHLLLILIIGLAAYSNTFNVPFHFDDFFNIVDNPDIADLSKFWPPSGSRWFGMLTFALNYRLGGLDTTGYHIFNLIVHIISAILVYYLVLMTLKILQQPFSRSLGENASNLIPLFSALFFVSHPVQTQAVTYIVQRLASLSTMLFLLSLLSYIKFRMAGADDTVSFLKSAVWYLFSFLFALLSMKTKEIAFTLPLVIITYEFMFLKGNPYKRFLCASVFFMAVPISQIDFNQPFEHFIDRFFGDIGETTRLFTGMSRWDYLFTQFRVIVTYIRLLFYPVRQNLDYDYPIYHSFAEPAVFLSFAFLLIIFLTGIYIIYRVRILERMRPESLLISFGILFFFTALSVESSIIPIKDVIFEHRIYLPSVGAFIAINTAILMSAQRFRSSMPLLWKIIFLALSSSVVLFSGATYARNIIWQDRAELWADALRKSPDKMRPLYNAGVYLIEKDLLDKGTFTGDEFPVIEPTKAEAWVNIGIILEKNRLYRGSASAFKKALEINPMHTGAWNNLGVVLMESGEYEQAYAMFETALNINPEFKPALDNIKIVEQYLSPQKNMPSEQ